MTDIQIRTDHVWLAGDPPLMALVVLIRDSGNNPMVMYLGRCPEWPHLGIWCTGTGVVTVPWSHLASWRDATALERSSWRAIAPSHNHGNVVDLGGDV